MHMDALAPELIHQIFLSLPSIPDVVHLAQTSHRYYSALHSTQRLPILVQAAETQFGPLDDAIQLVTHNSSQAAHLPHAAQVPVSLSLIQQLLAVGRVANRWEDIYPFKKWRGAASCSRRLLSAHERYVLRRALYRLWLYTRAFHNRAHPRETRGLGAVVRERAALLQNWSSAELAEIDDVRRVLRDVVANSICPSNGTVARKFRKRCPDADPHQHLFFNFQIHVTYPPPPPSSSSSSSSSSQSAFYTSQRANKAIYNKYAPSRTHDPGSEGWGDEIPHYYVVEDMLKLDPSQILWLKDHATCKAQVEAFVGAVAAGTVATMTTTTTTTTYEDDPYGETGWGGGDWFENNGETLSETLGLVLESRGFEADADAEEGFGDVGGVGGGGVVG
ncbi:MAG: hypothetical protein M1819_005184 [Sarea resinae]|nr:MAG: hypothetical protein M1819_005184 [Sarea resinae]